MAYEINQWRVRCEVHGWVYISRPAGAPAPTECSIEPSDTIDPGRTSLRTRMHAATDLSGTWPVPGAANDASEGWAVGSTCLADDGRLYVCLDATEGAARWREAINRRDRRLPAPSAPVDGGATPVPVQVAAVLWDASSFSGHVTYKWVGWVVLQPSVQVILNIRLESTGEVVGSSACEVTGRVTVALAGLPETDDVLLVEIAKTHGLPPMFARIVAGNFVFED